MKNKCYPILLIACFCLGGMQGVAQSAYYDALKIKSDLVDNEITSISAKVLFKYFIFGSIPPVKKDTLDSLKVYLKKNPFFEKYKLSTSGVESSLGVEIRKTIGSVGGLDVTNIANGISQFMIKRAKEELTIAFFERFRKFAEENPEFSVLFPKTTNNLDNLLTYKYPEFLPALRTGFFEDIRTSPYHLDDVLELPRYQSLLKDLPEVKVSVRSVRLINELQSGQSHAADLLTKIAAFPEWKEASSSGSFKNFGNSVRLANIFSQSLRRDSTDTISSGAWITFPQLDVLVSNDTTLNIYLGLVYQLVTMDTIRFYFRENDANRTLAFNDLMERQKDNLFLFRNKLTEFIELTDRVDKIVDTVKFQNRRQVISLADAYYDYIDVSLDVLDYAFSVGSLFDERLDIGQYTLVARSANDLYRNIYKQEYTQAINNLVDILDLIKMMVDENNLMTVTHPATLLDDLKIKNSLNSKSLVSDLRRKDIAAINTFINTNQSIIETSADQEQIQKLTDQLSELKQYKSLYHWDHFGDKLSKISEYGLFMANMANAQSPQEVASILDNATLPVGSSSIKKNSISNVAIQSYLGPYVRFGEIDNTNAWTSRFGVTAPIGIAFSKGFREKGSVSLFLSLLDLGAIVDYQLTAETITTPDGTDTTMIHKDYRVELGQIFSPGTYLVYGLPWRLPLSFGIGGQYGPGLGKIEDDNDVVINNPAWRWNAFLAVDIPLFNLANTPRRN